MLNKSIIYVNFAPYDNAGRILDFLKDNFSLVIHFSYDHLRLKRGKRSEFIVYKNGNVIYKKNLLWLRTHPMLLFPSLPFVAVVIFFQTLFYSAKYKSAYGKIDYYLTVNAFSMWTGNIIRDLGIVKKTIYWVWDYFPPDFPDIRLKITRWLYWKLDYPARLNSNKVVYLNEKLRDVRIYKEKSKKKSIIIPIGTNPNPKPKFTHTKKILIGHLGMLKTGQGLDLLFDALPEIIKKYPQLRIEIIGSGPQESYFKNRARKFVKNIKFLGFVNDDNDVDKLISRWNIGLATYLPVKWSEHYYTDPSKIKVYLNQAIPVITTYVPEFSREIIENKAGVVINYETEELLKAIDLILKKNKFFSKKAYLLSKKYVYSELYKKLFFKL